MSGEEGYRESVHEVTTEYVETRSRVWHHEGTNDYRNTIIRIEELEDREGKECDLIWNEEPTEVCPGVTTWSEGHGARMRINREACPVRVLFREYFEYVSYTDSEHNSSWTTYFWVRYEAS